jgi:hypothetical protein
MRLEVKLGGHSVHTELVAAVGWNSKNELYSCGDDKQIARWDVNGDSGGKVRRRRALTPRERDVSHPRTTRISRVSRKLGASNGRG